MVEIKNVLKRYPNNTVALNNINLKINKGDFVFIVGPSGSGKTTLLKLIMKEEDVNTGEIIVNGFCVSSLNRRKIPYLRRSLGVVFQDFRLLSNKTVYENIAFAMQIIGSSPKDIRRQVPMSLGLVGLSKKANCYPDELSGGEKQRVALARAIVNNPSLLLADEPTGNLDPENSWEIMKLLSEINHMGTTVVIATHEEKIVDSMRKRVIALEKGVLSETKRKEIIAMKVRTYKYLIKEGFINTFRNKLMSIASINIVIASLVVLGIFLLMSINLNYNTKMLMEQPEIEVFCNINLDDQQVNNIETVIKKDTFIKNYRKITKNEAYEKAKELLGNSKEILDGIDAEFLPVSFKLTLQNISSTRDVAKRYNKLNGVSKARYSEKEINLLINAFYWTRLLSIILAALFFVCAMFIISNTIKLAVYARRKEINIMKYIGATDWFIRWPFIIEGIIIGILGAVIAFVLVGYGYTFAVNSLTTQIKLIKFIKLNQIGFYIILVYLIVGAIIGAIGSFISIRKHLRV